MNKIEELRNLFVFDANMTASNIELRFEKIAKMLFNSFAVEHNGSRYVFKEIEFYFYNKQHQDIITHPRSSKALQWYINEFGGIDLNFESSINCEITIDGKKKSHKKYLLDEQAVFGGILIRKLIKEDGTVILDGPLACAELFRNFSATKPDTGLPCLIESDNGNVGFIREPRINILPNSKTIEHKVKTILGLYNSHPSLEELSKQFTVFKNKRYRYIRCETLMHDSETNMVYFSPWLNDEKDGHPEFYHRLKELLNGLGIKTGELKSTEDYWVRDFMPIQLSKNEYFKYVYKPDYLVKSKNPDDKQYITDCNNVIRGMGLNCHKTDLVIDGGNMVSCGSYIVMTNKIFQENYDSYKENPDDFKNEFESELGHPVIIIPWTMHGDFDAEDTDKYGHSDGFVKWCGGNRILMGNHGDEYPTEAKAIRSVLEEHGFEVTEMRFKDKVEHPCADLNWAYINFLQVGQHIILPSFNIEEDIIAYKYVKDAFPNCEIHQIEMAEIAIEGGAMHCISWNIQL